MSPTSRRRRAWGMAVALAATSVLLVAPAGPTRAVGPTVALEEVANLPKAIAFATRPATGANYVGTQDGRVWMLRPGQAPLLALDMRAYTKAAGERGLLGLAFHPTLPYVYISHTSLAGNSRLVEYAVRVDGTFRRSSRRTVLALTQPYGNHNGGHLAFGPDGYLYVGFGDGGSGGDPRRYALKLNTWLGKILRIDPRPSRTRAYKVPADNPYVGVRGAKPEIWARGLRNPWRWSFDTLTGDLWIADVGQGQREEVNLAPASTGRGKGVSFGWSAWEGSLRYNADQAADGHQAPLYEYGHDVGCSITGGVVYRGTALPGLVGKYLFADFCAGTVWALTLDGGAVDDVTAIASVDNPVSFGVDAAGEVYVLSLGGSVARLVPPPD